MQRAADILESIGIEKERLGMFFMSGSQARAFATAAHTMTERVRKLVKNRLLKESFGAQEVHLRGVHHLAGDRDEDGREEDASGQ